MIGIREEITFYTHGKEGVLARLKLLHGDKSIVIKGKRVIAPSATTLVGRTLTPDQFTLIFGEGVYPDWGGKENTLHVPAKLISVESNKASTYLVFKQD
jgi:hypothetical protein